MAELLSLALESYSAVLLSTWTWYLGATVFDFDVVSLFQGRSGGSVGGNSSGWDGKGGYRRGHS